MSGGSAERLLPPDEAGTRRVASSRPGDRIAALLTGPDRPTACEVGELLRVWRDAQRDATDTYASWRELTPRDGHPAFLAALDREERAAEVYAKARKRAIEWTR